MSKWEQPDQRLLKLSEPSTTGRGLGFINEKHFESATWEPLLSTEWGRGQYCKFVAAMIERIRLKESSSDEIRSFVRLVATERNWDFMKVALPYLPELKEQYPHDPKNFEMALLFLLLKPEIRQRDIEEISKAISVNNNYDNGLSPTEELFLRHQLFGPDRGAVDSSGMNRLFKSTLELGFPLAALHNSMREAVERGTDIERCPQGLPSNLRMPNQHQGVGAPKVETQSISAAPSTVPSSSTIAATPQVGTPNTSAAPSTVPSLSVIAANNPSDSLPGERQTATVADGASSSVLTNTSASRMSQGDLLCERDGSGIFNARLAASTERPQVPRPGILRDEAEQDLILTNPYPTRMSHADFPREPLTGRVDDGVNSSVLTNPYPTTMSHAHVDLLRERDGSGIFNARLVALTERPQVPPPDIQRDEVDQEPILTNPYPTRMPHHADLPREPLIGRVDNGVDSSVLTNPYPTTMSHAYADLLRERNGSEIVNARLAASTEAHRVPPPDIQRDEVDQEPILTNPYSTRLPHGDLLPERDSSEIFSARLAGPQVPPPRPSPGIQRDETEREGLEKYCRAFERGFLDGFQARREPDTSSESGPVARPRELNTSDGSPVARSKPVDIPSSRRGLDGG